MLLQHISMCCPYRLHHVNTISLNGKLVVEQLDKHHFLLMVQSNCITFFMSQRVPYQCADDYNVLRNIAFESLAIADGTHNQGNTQVYPVPPDFIINVIKRHFLA